MSENSLSNIRGALASIETLNDRAGEETYSSANIASNNELVLELNTAAGVALCRSILDLVESGVDGKHQHFDKINFIDEGDAKLVIVFRNKS
ncbi:hypothetical protein [Citromicrobium sp. RCC1885]|nr:hypothetical protein [Citromicrobium sp. RCC1885]